MVGALLKNHVAQGVFPEAFLVDGYEVTMLSGLVATVTVTGFGQFAEVSIEGAAISVGATIASNGLAHVIEGVILEGIDLTPGAYDPPPVAAPVAALPPADMSSGAVTVSAFFAESVAVVASLF